MSWQYIYLNHVNVKLLDPQQVKIYIHSPTTKCKKVDTTVRSTLATEDSKNMWLKTGSAVAQNYNRGLKNNCDINFYVFGSRTMNVNQYWLWVKQFNIYTVQINTLPRQFYEI